MQKEQTQALQDKMMNTLKKHSKNGLAKDIEHVMGLSRSSAHRYVSGKTEIGLNEMFRLCEYLEVPLENLFPKRKGQVIVNMASVDAPFEKAEDYPIHLLKLVSFISQLPNSSLIYLSNEVPVPYFFKYPTIFAFKMYVWGRNTFQQEEYRDEKFSPEKILNRRGLEEMRERMLVEYKGIPRKEIWTSSVLNRTFSQIEYCQKLDLFENDKVIQDMMSELKELLKENIVEEYKSGADKNRTIYHQPFFNAEDIIIVESDTERRIISTFFNPDYFISDDSRLIKSSKGRLEDFIRSSSLLDDEGSRIRFYRELDKKIEGFLSRLWKIA